MFGIEGSRVEPLHESYFDDSYLMTYIWWLILMSHNKGSPLKTWVRAMPLTLCQYSHMFIFYTLLAMSHFCESSEFHTQTSFILNIVSFFFTFSLYVLVDNPEMTTRKLPLWLFFYLPTLPFILTFFVALCIVFDFLLEHS